MQSGHNVLGLKEYRAVGNGRRLAALWFPVQNMEDSLFKNNVQIDK